MADTNKIGNEGEMVVRRYLTEKGITILHTNWRWHHFELDVVATDGENLIVIEVKTRSENALISPEEAVDNKKIRRTVIAADNYVRIYDIDLPVRFDIFALTHTPGGYQIDHMEDAFYATAN